MGERHVWLSDSFSVPEHTLCMDRAPSPDADCFCLRSKGHRGKHEFTWSPTVRDYSWKEKANG